MDCNVLRVGAYELLWGEDVPDGVAISEAILLLGHRSLARIRQRLAGPHRRVQAAPRA